MSAVIAKPLLIELFTEELPPKALKKLGEAFAAGVEARLRNDGLLNVFDFIQEPRGLLANDGSLNNDVTATFSMSGSSGTT